MQRLAAGHDTPVRTVLSVPPRGWIDHGVPSRRSARFGRPTAVQALGEVHDTPVNCCAEPDGLGVGWTDHEVPFQASASVPSPLPPTAMQVPTDAHDTPDRKGPAGGFGVGWIDHVVPFQRSASVTESLPKLSTAELPTAVQALAEVQDTAARALRGGDAGLGVGWSDHEEPFQRSAS